MKESHASDKKKKNDAEEYADNLISYLDNARSMKNKTADLNNVLHRLIVTQINNDTFVQ